ncbi:glucose 1-dehydrogenase [uncultured Paludibaculum sp.]|uniref:SDR family NAD(P)-dependent oxidoreductase n=1 Tax=uncultured Paludibaculum sp. TaxID=1765020 RepID=UPI002AABE29A|nr:glucose 1-dehydrogenase [uncultured Paludibaculum sp.]
MCLKDKVAIVTGAGRGIGAALARGLAREGASVVVNYSHSAGAAGGVVREIESLGGRALAIQADVGQTNQHESLVQGALDAFGRLDILVNNAAVETRMPALDVTPEEWDRILAIDLKGPFFLSQRAAQRMKAQRSGVILNISSVHDERAHRNNSVYTIAKGGMRMMTRNLALEWAEYGIRVNALAPGAILTDMNRDVLADPVYEARVVSTIPLGRIGSVDELVGTAVLLVSDAGSYITGSTFYVDGGLLL